MKLLCLPTLGEIRDMLGEELYVKFIWMWREQEQNARSVERRAKFAALLPAAKVNEWPTPVFARVEERLEEPAEKSFDERLLPTPAQAFQAALLRAPRPGDRIEVGQFENFLERVGARQNDEEPREIASAGGRRRRR